MTVKRRFVVGIDQETSEDVSSFFKYIEQQEFGWWHWIGNLWLLTTDDKQITVVAIRDKLTKITNGGRVIVIEVSSTYWATYGPKGEKSESENMSRWIHDSWDKS